jgi:hypothetical protein
MTRLVPAALGFAGRHLAVREHPPPLAPLKSDARSKSTPTETNFASEGEDISLVQRKLGWGLECR